MDCLQLQSLPILTPSPKVWDSCILAGASGSVLMAQDDLLDFDYYKVPLAKTSDDYYTPKWIFDLLDVEFDIDCRYKKFMVYPTGQHTEIEVDYDFLKIKKITYPEETVDIISKKDFFNEVQIGPVYDDYLDFLYDDFLQDVMSIFSSNVRFFNPQIDWFDLNLK